MKKRKSIVRRAAAFLAVAAVILSVSATPSVSQLATRGVVTEAERDTPPRPATDDLLPSGKRSDGCTLIPDGDFRDCCVAHDREYFHGGSPKERRAADERLYMCIRKKEGIGHKFIAPFVWFGVRIGGVSFLPTPFRWGFGNKEKNIDKPTQPPVTNP